MTFRQVALAFAAPVLSIALVGCQPPLEEKKDGTTPAPTPNEPAAASPTPAPAPTDAKPAEATPAPTPSAEAPKEGAAPAPAEPKKD